MSADSVAQTPPWAFSWCSGCCAWFCASRMMCACLTVPYMRRLSLAMLWCCQADRRRPHNVRPSSLGGLLDDGGEGLGQLAGLLALAIKRLGIGGGWPAVGMVRGGCGQLLY